MFEVVAEERNGKSHAIISESKGGVVSWGRLGPASVGLLIEGLIQCTKDGKDGRWEKGWKEKGRFYSLVREANRAGSFIRLGVTDLEKRRFGICIPKGKGEKGGWASMVESLLWVGFWREEEVVDQGVRDSGRSYVEVAKGSELKDTSRAKVETKEEDIRNNVSRLKQCLIGKWNPKSAREEDLARLGWSAARGWGLKGKLGLARLGKGCALLELRRWKKLRGFLPRGRVGEECGGFLGIDPLTERKEDLEWARIQVKMNGGALPSSLEIGVEGEIYVVSLWWEIPPAIRKKQGDGRDEFGQQRGEVRGDGDPRAGWRVGEKPGAGTKEQRRSEEVTGEQVGGEGGGDVFENWTHIGRVARQSSGPVGDGSSSSGSGLGLVGLKRDYGPATQGPLLSKGAVLAADGLECGPAEGRASEGLELLSHGPAISVGGYLGQLQSKYMGIGSEEDLGLKMEMEFIKCREKEISGKQMPALQCSMAEREIVGEAFRYGSSSNLRVGESFLFSSSLFGRTPEREFCDHSGDLRVSRQKENMIELAATGGIQREEGAAGT
ncbi:hypothetical protein CK203_040954 [Vitis vinifera]|uniref:DUF4283 domain-containing protein n=1 Tax=Vitis vinifera TaxID=29760 RepID=A0A438HVB5_VITVI|nr:hypothetical protein CK203_040954 [Vitis vinifera]